MDPKKVSDLDPKLKEVYERVMGTKVATGSAPTPPATPVVSSPEPSSQTQQDMVLPKTQSASAKPTPPATVQVFTSKGGTTNAAKTEEKKDGSPVLTIVLVLAGLLFFSIYALFWFRFFHIKLPFALPF